MKYTAHCDIVTSPHLLAGEVVEGVEGHPDHTDQGEAEAQHLSPLRVAVVTIGHWGVGDLIRR